MTAESMAGCAPVWTGALAPAVWLSGALLMSHVERAFMDRLGWDVWPSGLALGPHGWGQVLTFLLFAACYLPFALAARLRCGWSRPASAGALVLLGGALLSPLQAFRTDPPGARMTWHGALHAGGYVALMLSMLLALALLYPGLVRRTSLGQWRLALVALLLLPPAWTAPNAKATSSYLFFAVPFAALAALALVLYDADRSGQRIGVQSGR